MQNISILQSQVESLKEMIEVMEMTNPDALIKKWRHKVFEELVRNKQQQIMHNIEIKKFKEEEKRFRSREQQIKAALESSHIQASSLNLERNKLQKEIQNLQAKVRGSAIHSANLLNLQSIMASNLETNARVIAMLDTFNHRITFSMSKIKTAKILHAREVFALRNKLSEEVSGQDKLKEEVGFYKNSELEREKLGNEVLRLTEEIEEVREEFEKAGKDAKIILTETHEKYKSFVDSLECQLDEKVKESDLLVQKIEILNQEICVSNETILGLRKELRNSLEESSKSKSEISFVNIQLENLNASLCEKDLELKTYSDLLRKIESDTAEADSERVIEINKLLRNIELQENQIVDYESKLSQLAKANLEILEDEKGEIDFLKGKILKLESQVREFRRERDILFESAKKSTNRPLDDKFTQTMNHTPIRKAL